MEIPCLSEGRGFYRGHPQGNGDARTQFGQRGRAAFQKALVVTLYT
jgi:hypothetical protein